MLCISSFVYSSTQIILFYPSDINECLSSPCGHGSCTDKVNSFVCECTFGYKGISCDECKGIITIYLKIYTNIVEKIICIIIKKSWFIKIKPKQKGYSMNKCTTILFLFNSNANCFFFVSVNTLLLLILLTFLPIVMLFFSFYLSKRIKHNK